MATGYYAKHQSQGNQKIWPYILCILFDSVIAVIVTEFSHSEGTARLPTDLECMKQTDITVIQGKPNTATRITILMTYLYI